MKILKCCKIYKNVAQRHAVSKCHWKNGGNRQQRVAVNLQFIKGTVLVKHTKVKHNKTKSVFSFPCLI